MRTDIGRFLASGCPGQNDRSSVPPIIIPSRLTHLHEIWQLTAKSGGPLCLLCRSPTSLGQKQHSGMPHSMRGTVRGLDLITVAGHCQCQFLQVRVCILPFYACLQGSALSNCRFTNVQRGQAFAHAVA